VLRVAVKCTSKVTKVRCQVHTSKPVSLFFGPFAVSFSFGTNWSSAPVRVHERGGKRKRDGFYFHGQNYGKNLQIVTPECSEFYDL
jgi:hypothetical protein